MKYAIDLKAEEVTILGATGTRYDHTLANISLLALLRDEGIDAQIVDVHNEIEILRGPAEKKYKKKYGLQGIGYAGYIISCMGAVVVALFIILMIITIALSAITGV